MTRGRGTKEPTNLLKKAQCGPRAHSKGLGRPRMPLPSSPRSPLPPEPSTLLPSSCPSPPSLKSRPPFFTVTIYSSFLFHFVRNGHKNQCKTISVGVLFYITKLWVYNIKGAHRNKHDKLALLPTVKTFTIFKIDFQWPTGEWRGGFCRDGLLGPQLVWGSSMGPLGMDMRRIREPEHGPQPLRCVPFPRSSSLGAG